MSSHRERKAEKKKKNGSSKGTNAGMRQDHDARSRAKKSSHKSSNSSSLHTNDARERKLGTLHRAFNKAASGTAWMGKKRALALLKEHGVEVNEAEEGKLGDVVNFDKLYKVLPDTWGEELPTKTENLP